MPVQEMRKWKQKTLLGVSLKVLAPTGQYDPTKLVNWGTNRWAFKPEFGYSKRRRKLLLDVLRWRVVLYRKSPILFATGS